MNARHDGRCINEAELLMRIHQRLKEAYQLIEQGQAEVAELRCEVEDLGEFLKKNFDLGQRIATEKELKEEAKKERQLIKASAHRVFMSKR